MGTAPSCAQARHACLVHCERGNGRAQVHFRRPVPEGGMAETRGRRPLEGSMSVESVSPKPNTLVAALRERLGLDGLAYPVPDHANTLGYTLGGITPAGFIILLVSGIYLAQFYHPHPADAHSSVAALVTIVPFGDVVRSVPLRPAQ